MPVEKIALVGGPPGSGKSSVANILSNETRLGYLSMGDHIREISSGKRESRYQDTVISEKHVLNRSGKLPQTLVCSIIEEHFKQQETESDLLLDGYPKSIEQVKPFFNTLTSLGATALTVVYLDINREEAIRRMLSRGSREGEQPINEDFAKMRHDNYTDSYEEVLEALSEEMPVCRIRANGSLSDNVTIAKRHLEGHFENL